MVIEEELVIALRNFHDKVEDIPFANLFLLARQRAAADNVDIVDAIMAELKLRHTL
jgi:hypothetical protein